MGDNENICLFTVFCKFDLSRFGKFEKLAFRTRFQQNFYTPRLFYRHRHFCRDFLERFLRRNIVVQWEFPVLLKFEKLYIRTEDSSDPFPSYLGIGRKSGCYHLYKSMQRTAANSISCLSGHPE